MFILGKSDVASYLSHEAKENLSRLFHIDRNRNPEKRVLPARFHEVGVRTVADGMFSYLYSLLKVYICKL